jgi:hypothetical protein
LLSSVKKVGKLSFWSYINQVMFKRALTSTRSFLTLSLFVAGLAANDPDHTISLNNFAFATNALH